MEVKQEADVSIVWHMKKVKAVFGGISKQVCFGRMLLIIKYVNRMIYGGGGGRGMSASSLKFSLTT